VTSTARLAIERAYLRGDTLEEIAKAAGVSVREADIYLCWWCDCGCPGAVTDC
jgi:DNA-directed RNA polymerase specialized sigma24 family protein